jgi:hypothetical protein
MGTPYDRHPGWHMAMTNTIGVPRRSSSLLIGVGVALAAAGLAGHLFAARAIGGSNVAYRDHIFGFCLITVVFGLIIAGLGWRFWKGRLDITVLILGAVNAIIGLLIYINRFRID